MPGLAITKTQFDDLLGTTARGYRLVHERARILKFFTDQYTSAQLASMGLVDDQAAGDLAKSAIAALVTNADAFDPTFPKRVWGLGVTNTGSF